MLRGEEPRRWPMAVFLAALAIVAVLAMLWAAQRYESALVDAEPPALVHQVELEAAEVRISALELDAEVASKAAMALEAQIASQKLALEAQAAELAEIKAALAAAQKAKARRPPRARKSVPDPPASSYIRLN